ncbi:hypothetical protein Tco_0998555 [Tanacetum coccineum]
MAGWCTICISSSLALSLTIMATPALVGNFIIPWVVDGTASKARCFPRDTRRSICPRGQEISLKNPMREAVIGTNLLLTSCLSLRKQCSYKALPPSMYIPWTSCFYYAYHFTHHFGDVIIEPLDQSGVRNVVHESEDFHQFRCSLKQHAFTGETLNEGFRRFSFSLIHMVEL